MVTRATLRQLIVELRGIEAVIEMDMHGVDPGIGEVYPIPHLTHRELREVCQFQLLERDEALKALELVDAAESQVAKMRTELGDIARRNVELQQIRESQARMIEEYRRGER